MYYIYTLNGSNGVPLRIDAWLARRPGIQDSSCCTYSAQVCNFSSSERMYHSDSFGTIIWYNMVQPIQLAVYMCGLIMFNQHNSIQRRYNEYFFATIATIATQKYEKFTSQAPGSRGGWWAIFGIDAKSGYLVA